MKLEGPPISLYVSKSSIDKISKFNMMSSFKARLCIWKKGCTVGVLNWKRKETGLQSTLICNWLRSMLDFTKTFPEMFFSSPWEAFKSTSKFLPIPFSVFWWNCWNLWRWKRFKKLGGHGIDGLCDKMLHLDIDKVLPESLWKNLI